MHDTRLLRKIVGPTLPTIFLHRTNLITQLQEAFAFDSHPDGISFRHKLVLCCAPAGYGKTTLLSDFVRSTSTKCCWYFLDPADVDPVVFLCTLLASVQQIFPHFGVSLRSLFDHLHSKGPSEEGLYRSVIDAFCTALASEIADPFILILSNYEEINESETLTDLVNLFLQKLPSWITLLIESRVIPDLSYTSLVIHDEICGLHTDILRFSAQEIIELTRLQGLPALTEAEAEHLVASFDGWIAGLLLGTRVGLARFRLLNQGDLNEHHSPRQVKALAEHQRNMLFAYVLNDVFKQDKRTATFFQSISIFQQIEPAICNALLDITDAAERLMYLEHQGFFLSSHESVFGVVYHCHSVIRELLSEQLRQQDPERFLALHRKAAELWLANRNEEQAMYHALAIGEHDLVVSLILTVAERLLQQGQRETVMLWLYALPSTIRECHPQLLVLHATILLERGQHALALPLLAKAGELVPDAPKAELYKLRASIAILQGKALCQIGSYTQAEVCCQQVLQSLPEQEQALRAAAEMRLGVCANLQGQFVSGITHLQRALSIWAGFPPLNQAIEIHSALANTYYLTGNLDLAQHHLSVMVENCEQIGDMSGKGSALILRGLIAQDRGLISEAEEAFSQVLTMSHVSPDMQRNQAYALVNLGSLYVEQGRYTQALTSAQEGLALARTFGNRSLINDALSSLALSYLFLDDAVSAVLMVEQMETREHDAATVGYERAGHDLTYGLILFTQRRYPEATACLAKIEAALNTTDLRRPRFRAKLRLAACRVAQDQLELAVHLLEEVASLLSVHSNSLHLVQMEVQWMPILLPVIQQHRALAPLRELLGIVEPPSQENEQVSSPGRSILADGFSARLTIYAFGEPIVLLDNQPIKRWRMARALELFFFLLDANRPCSKEAILTALWPEYDEQTVNTFRNTIYHLRKLFGEACVVLSPAGYQLDLAACYGERIFYDVQAFQQYRCEAERALALTDTASAKDSLLKMVQLYQGDYGRSFYSEWCTFRRDSLRTAYLEVRHQLAQIAWQAEAWNECAEHWREMLRLDTCLEEAHYGLMRCYLKQRMRGAALRQYQLCQEILQQELGVQPGQALQNLYQHLTTKQSAD